MLKTATLLSMLAITGTLSALSSYRAPSDRLSAPQATGEDRAGPYIITHEDAATGEKAAEIRTFIWKHWTEHGRGSVSVTSYSLEGVRSDATFILGTDEQGAWNINVKIERPSLKDTNAEHGGFRAYSVQRIKPRHDGQSPAKVIPEQEALSGKAYRLVFYDQKGTEVGGF